MRYLICLVLFCTIIFTNSETLAQGSYSISGIIRNEKNEPLSAATVFISGSQKITSTDTAGRFTFGEMAMGNYLVSVRMLGYETSSRQVTIHDNSASIVIQLKVKPIILSEVKIGSDKNREKLYAIFKEQFLGTSASAKNCVIINPDIINFTSKKIGLNNIFVKSGSNYILLKADADDLLIIENRQLGYRIRYLLKSFEYNAQTHTTFYDGDNNFEEMDGTDEQKQIWQKNRLEIYRGSLMHFLRSVFANTVLSEGFITRQMYKSSDPSDMRIHIKQEPITLDSMVTRLDSAFIYFKFTALHITYDPQKALASQKQLINGNEPQSDENTLTTNNAKGASQLLLHLKNAVIDVRGSVATGYQTFLIRGDWANYRIGDQLPFEYQPPKITN